MPRVGRRQVYIEAGLVVAEYGLEYLNFVNVGAQANVTGAAVAYHFKSRNELRAAVIDLARQRRNPFVLGQLKAMRVLSDQPGCGNLSSGWPIQPHR